VHLDRLHGYEQRLGDLLVAQFLGCHVRDAPLAGGERVDTAQEDRARTRAGRRELLVGPLDERGKTLTATRAEQLLARPGEPLSPFGSSATPRKEFTEPVALSSTQPTDRPLPRRAVRLSFDLVALRARCTQDAR
jgi:hypothetical protein